MIKLLLKLIIASIIFLTTVCVGDNRSNKSSNPLNNSNTQVHNDNQTLLPSGASSTESVSIPLQQENLSELYIDFSHDNIGDEELTNIVNNLPNLTNLKSLHLDNNSRMDTFLQLKSLLTL